MTLIPAYGRDYKSAKAAKADWDADKDFIIADFGNPYQGKPINKAQLQGSAIIRFNSQCSVTVVKGGA